VRVGLVVPVKSFRHAKQRLAGVLDHGQRAALARWCAQRVVAAAGELPVFVVCDDAEVAQWAREAGVTALWSPDAGLNPAVDHAVRELRRLGLTHAVISHSDVPLARGFERFARPGTVTLVPDDDEDGTNALGLPTDLAGRFRFQYGRASFRKHTSEALRLGTAVRVVRDPLLARDLDSPSDLSDPRLGDLLAWLPMSPANPR
jgi:2-phospho-L-lactate guanylyltransferase